MSWYAAEMVTCYKCGRRFSTPIDRLNHSDLCRWRTHRYPNGSIERKDFNGDFGDRFICAPSGFGGNWKVTVSGYAPKDAPVRIKRKGKLWEAVFVDGVGFTWVAVPNGEEGKK